MMDDDLNKLLSIVDEESEHEASRAARVQRHEEAAPGGEIARLSDHDFAEIIKRLELSEDVLLFRKGITQAISGHSSFAKNFRRVFTEKEIPDSINQLVQNYKYTYIRFIENIEKLYDDSYPELSLDTVHRKAEKDYELYFTGFEEENRLHFLVLLEMFEGLRDFNSRVRKEWNDLLKSIGVVNLSVEGKAFYKHLNETVEAGIRLCGSTDAFLKRIARILSLSELDYHAAGKELFQKTLYRDGFSYRYEHLFGDQPQVLETAGEDAAPDGDAARAPADRAGAERIVAEDASVPAEADTRVAAADVKFTVRGKTGWNTREPYLIKIDREKLERDYDDLGISFYFSTGDEGGPLEGVIKRAMIRYLNDPSKTIEEEYEEFVYKNIISLVELMRESFRFQGDMQNLFIYHLGPMNMYRQMHNRCQIAGVGFCYKYLPGNKVVRYLPMEFFKEKILNWHEENINTLELEFDKVQFFDEIRRSVAKKYAEELEKYNARIEEIVRKHGLESHPRFNRQEFFKSKWNTWFGVENIVVYNRFLERTLFK